MFGPYAGYIIPSYLVTAATFAGVVVWSLLDYRARKRELARLEEQGVRRRSQAGAEQANG